MIVFPIWAALDSTVKSEKYRYPGDQRNFRQSNKLSQLICIEKRKLKSF